MIWESTTRGLHPFRRPVTQILEQVNERNCLCDDTPSSCFFALSVVSTNYDDVADKFRGGLHQSNTSNPPWENERKGRRAGDGCEAGVLNCVMEHALCSAELVSSRLLVGDALMKDPLLSRRLGPCHWVRRPRRRRRPLGGCLARASSAGRAAVFVARFGQSLSAALAHEPCRAREGCWGRGEDAARSTSKSPGVGSSSRQRSFPCDTVRRASSGFLLRPFMSKSWGISAKRLLLIVSVCSPLSPSRCPSRGDEAAVGYVVGSEAAEELGAAICAPTRHPTSMVLSSTTRSGTPHELGRVFQP